MATNWRRCAGIILLTGSISSTSGAETTCAAPPPSSAEAALKAVSSPSGDEIAYREEVRHPALTSPEVATGTLRALPDGRFVKDQTTPRREISEIADGFVRIRRGPEAEANLLPIPSEMQPLLRVLALAAGGRLGEMATMPDLGFDTTPDGWQVTLATGEGPDVRLIGCGRRLARIVVREPGGVERSYLLGVE